MTDFLTIQNELKLELDIWTGNMPAFNYRQQLFQLKTTKLQMLLQAGILKNELGLLFLNRRRENRTRRYNASTAEVPKVSWNRVCSNFECKLPVFSTFESLKYLKERGS